MLMLSAAGAHAEITCAQLFEIAAATVELRDRGTSLTTVLKNTEDLRKANKLTEQDLQRVRQVVQESFTRARSPFEIFQECEAQKSATRPPYETGTSRP
ncbi:MAG: hypothetical protein HY323_07620 [Betaproteobacteria bacterium]|nr:hypothetical protein [Betaproteobacteria bacterium]MBI3936831.1 hypothetical protein [Betaproteobacteria bacterium]